MIKKKLPRFLIILSLFFLAVSLTASADTGKQATDTGNSNYVQGKYYEAIEQYNLAIAHYLKVNPQDKVKLATLYYYIANSYEELNKYAEAIAAYKKALDYMPNSALIHNNLGYVYYQLDRYNDALAEYQLAIKVDPKFARSYLGIAVIFDLKKGYQTALSYYQKYLQLVPATENTDNVKKRVEFLKTSLPKKKQ